MKYLTTLTNFFLWGILIYLFVIKISNYHTLYAKFAMNEVIQDYRLYWVFNTSIILEGLAIIVFWFKKEYFQYIVLSIFLVNFVFLMHHYIAEGVAVCSCILLFKDLSLISNLLLYFMVILMLLVLIFQEDPALELNEKVV